MNNNFEFAFDNNRLPDWKRRILTEQLTQVFEILSNLTTEINLNFILNFAVRDKNSGFIHIADSLHNIDLAGDLAAYFLQNTREIYMDIDFLPRLVRYGLHLVVCKDAKNPPENIGDWITEGRCYLVKEMLTTVDPGVFSLKLAGMNVNEPYDGYNSKRFERLFVPTMFN